MRRRAARPDRPGRAALLSQRQLLDQPRIRRAGERGETTVYALKRNSSSEIRRAIRNAFFVVHGMDEEQVRQAVLEAEHAIQRAISEGVAIPLAPRPPGLRKLQHRLIARYHLEATSMGSEPQRHLVIHPPGTPAERDWGEGLEELEVAVPPVQLLDEEVDARLERMRQADAQYRLAEGRQEVAAGDEVTMDYVVVVDGLEQPLEERTAIKVRVGEQSRFPDEVEAALAKAVLEQATPVGFTFPEGHPNKDLAGKPSTFTFTVREIKEKLVPELDDEWARDHEQESLAELRASVTAELRQEKDQAREHQVEQAILGKLVEKHPFEIPPGLAKAEVEKRMDGLLRMFGGSAEGLGEETFESLRRATRDRAHEDIRKAVLIRAIIGQEKIEVADAEVEARIGELAQKGPESPAKIRARYAPEQARETLRADLQEERALAFLKSKVRIVEAEVPATTEA